METENLETTEEQPERRLGTFSASGGFYDAASDSIHMVVDAADIQAGDRLSFHRDFFEHPTLFGRSGEKLIALAVEEGFKRVSEAIDAK